MNDIEKLFAELTAEHGLDIKLSFDMPEGYSNAHGTYDFEKRTLFYNSKIMDEFDEYDRVFILCHELRHAMQYDRPEEFSEEIQKSLPYVVMYTGKCYKFVNGKYLECTLDGDEEYFTDIYLNTPYEIDANEWAAKKCHELFPDKADGRELYLPENRLPFSELEKVYARIDEATGGKE